jgi:hypothetical protein
MIMHGGGGIKEKDEGSKMKGKIVARVLWTKWTRWSEPGVVRRGELKAAVALRAENR